MKENRHHAFALALAAMLTLAACGDDDSKLIGPNNTEEASTGGGLTGGGASGSTGNGAQADGGADAPDGSTSLNNAPNPNNGTTPPPNGSNNSTDPPPTDPPPTDPPPTEPRGPAEIMVYSANVENLPKTSDGCPGDWKDLFAYMQIQIAKPDIFLVQQVTDQAQLDQIVGYMTTNLGRPYAGVIAEANPVPFNSPCGAQKEKQTNALIYATDRLSPASAPLIWRSYKNVNGTCQLDTLSRTRAVGMKLLDSVSNEFVSAASIHWSTRNGPGGDPACAIANLRETDQQLRVNHPDATLYVFGGDANEPDTAEPTTSSAFNPWYAEASLTYLDPIYEDCRASNLRACLLDNWTFDFASGKRRIDFMFTRRSTGMPTFLRAHTITFNQGDAADLQLTGSDNAAVGYSDHRAILTRMSY